MLEFKATREQKKVLEGIAYWNANAKRCNSESDIKLINKTIISLFHEADALLIPFWVQNKVLKVSNNWERYNDYYLDYLLKFEGVII